MVVLVGSPNLFGKLWTDSNRSREHPSETYSFLSLGVLQHADFVAQHESISTEETKAILGIY